MIDGFHGEGEVTNDLTKIHDPEVTTLTGSRLFNPRIKRQAHPCRESSKSVRSFGLVWVFAFAAVRGDPVPSDGVAAWPGPGQNTCLEAGGRAGWRPSGAVAVLLCCTAVRIVTE
jgi:hypothetical protein